MEEKEYFMKQALKEAYKAYKKGEVPVGAVIVKNNQIIARGYNQKELKNSPIKHAEIIAIEKACKKLNNWRLNDCDMYVTLEPCAMCAGAIINSRIAKIYIGTLEPKTGACISKINMLEDYTSETKVDFETGILQNECEKILKDFFKERRKENNLRRNK